MPNLKTYSFPQICGLFDEAIRTIPGYEKYDPTYEPKALIDYEKTKDNYALYINPCMLHEKGEKNKSKKIETMIKEKTGKSVRKDAVACSLIITLPRDYEGDEKAFFEAASQSLCMVCGIKESDILYACIHMDETQPHLHFSFVPISYVRDYDSKRSQWESKVSKAKENGTKVPARPASLKGDWNRKIKEDEIATGCNCGRFNKGFLHSLNKNLESRMAELGVECHIGNGAGSQFDPQKLNHQQREESVKLYEENEKLKKQNEAMQAELNEAYGKLRNVLESVKTELEEKEIEIAEYESKEKSLKELIQQLKKELADLVKVIALFIPNLISIYIKAWKEAKSEIAKKKVDEEAKAKAQSEAEGMYSRLKGFEEKANELLQEEEMISGVKMATFNQTPQRIGFAKKQILKAAERMGQAEIFENRPEVLERAVADWFDLEKYQKTLQNMSDLDAKLFMDSMVRAERAVETVLLEIDLEAEKEIE